MMFDSNNYFLKYFRHLEVILSVLKNNIFENKKINTLNKHIF